MAKQLIDQMTDDFDPARFQDTYRLRLEEGIKPRSRARMYNWPPDQPEPSKVTDLMEALQASVEATKQRRSA